MIDADFFREFFRMFVGEYAEHRGLQRNTTDLLVAVTLEDGRAALLVAGRWEARRGNLSEQERHHVDLERDARTAAELEDADLGPKVFDETRRGRPGN